MRKYTVIVFGMVACLMLVRPGVVKAQNKSASYITVKTTAGLVRGTFQNDIDVFKGIPYAAPPVGEYRWRPPQPVRPWEGVLDASQFRSGSAQAGWPPRKLKIMDGTSEDCLYLNLWKPHNIAADGKLPVMVWIMAVDSLRGIVRIACMTESILPGKV